MTEAEKSGTEKPAPTPAERVAAQTKDALRSHLHGRRAHLVEQIKVLENAEKNLKVLREELAAVMQTYAEHGVETPDQEAERIKREEEERRQQAALVDLNAQAAADAHPARTERKPS